MDVALVVARPDLPQGKHQVLTDGPVKQVALQLGLPVVQPADVNAAWFVAFLASMNLDLLVVADFGQILSRDCLASARLGGINIHASLLPAYRGAAPVAWAILNGESKSGVSIIQMTPRLDAGGVILQSALDIDRSWTAGALESQLADLGAALAVLAVERLQSGTAQAIPQEDRLASKAPKLKKADGCIDWSQSAEAIYNRIRALQPWPVAYSDLMRAGKEPMRLQIVAAVDPLAALDTITAQPAYGIGTVVAVARSLDVQTGHGILQIVRIKPAGKSEMDVPTFCRGNAVQVGDRFG